MNVKQTLSHLGLSHKEISVYLAALESGQTSALSLAHKSNLKRPTCYQILEQLIEKGLITKIARTGKTLYSAELPNHLAYQFETRAQQARDLFPKLKRLKKKDTEPTIKVFRGKQSLEQLYLDVISGKDTEIYSIFSPDSLQYIIMSDFIDTLRNNRIKNNVFSHSLIPEKMKKQNPGYLTSPEELREAKQLPKEMSLEMGVAIYGKNKVALFPDMDSDMGILIQNKSFHNTMKSIYDALEKYVAK